MNCRTAIAVACLRGARVLAADRAVLRKVAARERCPSRLHKQPFFAALNFCCANYNRTDEDAFGAETSVCRNFGKGFPPCDGRAYH